MRDQEINGKTTMKEITTLLLPLMRLTNVQSNQNPRMNQSCLSDETQRTQLTSMTSHTMTCPQNQPEVQPDSPTWVIFFLATTSTKETL